MRLLAFALAAIALSGTSHAERTYPWGGRIPLPEDLQQQLDERVETIRPGLNGERLRTSGFHPERFVRAMIYLADSIEAGLTPGAVVYVDSYAGDNMAVGAGVLYEIPEPRDADWSGFYELGDLTGPVVVTPLALRALERGDFRLHDTVADHLPRFAETGLEAITVEQLLRHSSGLPGRLDLPDDVRTREGLLDLLAEVELTSPPGREVHSSVLNFLLLGLMLEEVLEEPIHKFAKSFYLHPLGMVNTTCNLPAQLRSRCAAGPMSDWHGRMVWGEAEDPTAYILGYSAGHGGLVSGPDDLGIFSRAMAHSWNYGIDDFITTGTMRVATRADMNVLGGESMGLGWQLNGFGSGSFGWTAENGSALWVDPKRKLFVVVLTNATHHERDGQEFRDEILPHFLEMTREAVRDMRDEAHLPPSSEVAPSSQRAGLDLRKGSGLLLARDVDRISLWFPATFVGATPFEPMIGTRESEPVSG